MTETATVQSAWKEFANSTHILFDVQPDDRPLDQFIEFRNTVLAIVETDKFTSQLGSEWTSALSEQSDIDNALLLELRSYSRALEIAKATKSTDEPAKGFLNRWLSRAATISGSVKDICISYAKFALTLFDELCSLFKRSE